MRYEDFQLHGTCQLHGSWHVRVIVNYVGLLFMCSVLSFMKLSVMLIDEIGSRSQRADDVITADRMGMHRRELFLARRR